MQNRIDGLYDVEQGITGDPSEGMHSLIKFFGCAILYL